MKTENGGWSAKWIWTHAAFGMNEFAYFRKAIVITRQVCRAVLLATAHNHYKAMINGVRVSGEVTPAPSNPVKNKLYNEYDITRHIQHGENVLSAMVCYLGGSGQNYVDGVPGLLMQLELTYSDVRFKELVPMAHGDACWTLRIRITRSSPIAAGSAPWRSLTPGKNRMAGNILGFPTKTGLLRSLPQRRPTLGS